VATISYSNLFRPAKRNNVVTTTLRESTGFLKPQIFEK